VRNT
jgi:hypothetical protein